MPNFNLFFLVILIIPFFPFKCNYFKFSVITAIYNTGKYLDESISSLIVQSCGFDKIQLILINDGSIDNTHEICMKYMNQYPDNIIYKNIEHGGVSKARNIGLEYAKGEYINFLDPDDFWDSNAFKYVINFYNQHKNVDIVSGRMKYFEAKTQYHILDYKFIKTREVNLLKQYKYIQLSAASCFFRLKIIKNKKFNEEIKFSEDIVFINTLLLNKPKIGFIREALYNYRKRKDGSSAIQNCNKDKSFYFDTLIKVHHVLINLSISLYNKIVPFIKYFLLYDIQFRIKTNVQKFLDHFNIIKYREMIDSLLNYIDKKFILKQKFLQNKIKLLILSRKYGKDLRNDMVYENNSLKYEGIQIINFYNSNNIIYWKFIDIKNNILHLEGKDNCWIERDKYFYYAVIGNQIYYPEYKDYIQYNFNTLYGVVVKGRILKFDIPIKTFKKQVVHIYISYLKNNIEVFPSFDLNSNIPPMSDGYYVSGNFILKKEFRNLIIYQYSKENEIIFENKYIEQLKLNKKEYLIQLREHNIKYRSKKNKNKKEIWLINDGLNTARDNGEYFFRYINKNKNKLIDSYFILSENSSDYERIKNIGNIISFESKEYLVKYLMADKIISSIPNPYIHNPFGKDSIYIYDMLHFDYIYLQNVFSNDQINLNFHRLNQNFKMIFTASKKEYKFFTLSNFGYFKENIKLTGFSRYDNLQQLKKYKKSEKIILIIPSWNINLKGNFEVSTLNNIYSSVFENNQYFEFYKNLINNEKLSKAMSKLNYKGYFCLQSSLLTHSNDFTKNSLFIIKNCSDYQNLLFKSSLLVTDSSTLIFDFAYMEKPIIYIQFEYNEYNINKNKIDNFEYKKDGFSPIYKGLEKSVDGIIEAIENGCTLKNKYLKRIKKYFAYSDDKNCFRIYNSIVGTSKKINVFYKIYKYIFHFLLIFFYICKILNIIKKFFYE